MRRNVKIWRDQNGIPHIEAGSEPGLYYGMGYAHGTDRALQMLLMRILGQGRVSEILDASDASLEVDLFFRRMNWSGNTEPQKATLPPKATAICESYCEGVNAAIYRRPPWEFRLLGYRPEPWRVDDILLLWRSLGYLTMAESQGQAERLLVEMVQAGVSREQLEELFPRALGGLDMELIREVRLQNRLVPPGVLWGAGLARMMASNNWAISGKKTASGMPILANDPHLEVNRLPSVWCEMVLKCRDDFAIGASLPGLPGVLIGRTRELAWGATYAFMDAEDSWVERCREGKYYREGEGWVPFRIRRETILRKKKEPVVAVFYENDHGVLEGDPNGEGYYLATKWAVSESGGAGLTGIAEVWGMRSVAEGMRALGQVEGAFNFVLADRKGNIGYQMTGLFPKRREGASGLVPLPGWDPENDWQGFASHEDLPRCMNPDQGFFATANQDLNRYGKAGPINMPMGPYRADRINDLLRQGAHFTPADMFRMHFDVYSLQAQAFLEILRPLLPDTPQGRILADWDLRYTGNSEGAFLFEAFYDALCLEVFGRSGLGEKVAQYLSRETGIFCDFYWNFDRILLSEDSAWFGGEDRETLYRRVASEALQAEPRPWGKVRRVRMSHLMFGGKLPAWFGFDRGPITIIGNRATIHQGQIYRAANRTTTFCPSFRMVTDLATEEVHSNLAGGPSDRRFSRWYCSGLKGWIKGEYKTLRSDGPRRRFP
jgi:penicillin amidase